MGGNGFGSRRFRCARIVDTKALDGKHQAALLSLHHTIDKDALFYILPQLPPDVITNDVVSLLIITGDVDFRNVSLRRPGSGDNDAAY